MIYALFDVAHHRVLDVFESGDHKLLLQDLVELYNQTTGMAVTTLGTVEEARTKVIDALVQKYFPMHAERKEHAAQGPVARARAVFEELGLSKPRKEHIEACAKLGIKRSTAAAQYQTWKAAHKSPGASATQ